MAGRYDNPIPPRFLAPIDCFKIPALPPYLTLKLDKVSVALFGLDLVDYGGQSSYICRLVGRYGNPVPYSRLSPPFRD